VRVSVTQALIRHAKRDTFSRRREKGDAECM